MPVVVVAVGGGTGWSGGVATVMVALVVVVVVVTQVVVVVPRFILVGGGWARGDDEGFLLPGIRCGGVGGSGGRSIKGGMDAWGVLVVVDEGGGGTTDSTTVVGLVAVALGPGLLGCDAAWEVDGLTLLLELEEGRLVGGATLVSVRGTSAGTGGAVEVEATWAKVRKPPSLSSLLALSR